MKRKVLRAICLDMAAQFIRAMEETDPSAEPIGFALVMTTLPVGKGAHVAIAGNLPGPALAGTLREALGQIDGGKEPALRVIEPGPGVPR